MAWPRIIHWGPILTISLICYIFYWTLYVMSVGWPWHTTHGLIHHVLFLTNVFGIVINYLHAMYHGPGYVPLEWTPMKATDQKYLQFCSVCNGFKSPRAHHCRSCGRCVIKMDHHCPWINNCVGHENHATFTRFVLHAPLGCGYAFYFQAYYLYQVLFSDSLTHEARYLLKSMNSAFLLFMSIGLSLGVTLSVSVLLFYQLRSILRNRTMVEDWILDKAEWRHKSEELPPFAYPYDLGWRQNCMQVFLLSWYARGDGVTWAVRDGCDQYTLTKEQIIQKKRKKERSRHYRCKEEYNGAYCPLRHGFKLFLSCPNVFEDRLAVSSGDVILVSRKTSRWGYGEKCLEPVTAKPSSVRRASGPKGWFPLKCATPLDKND